MGVKYFLDRCKNPKCRKRPTATTDMKCVRCGYDYYEEIFGEQRKPAPVKVGPDMVRNKLVIV